MEDEDALRATVRSVRALRKELLLAIYDQAGGRYGIEATVELAPLAAQRGWEEPAVRQAGEFCEEAGLLKFPFMSSDVAHLTAAGLQAVEEAIDPAEGDPLETISAIELRAVEAALHQLQQAVERDQLQAQDPADLEEVKELLRTLEQQLRGRPRKRVLRAILQVLSTLLLGMGGNFATDLARMLPGLLR